MSLLKQLLLSVTVAVLAIVAGTLVFSIGSARSYLDAQVRSESENAAGSLAITLSQPANQEPVIRELLLMALYDTGRFQAVRFAQVDGAPLFERRRDLPGADDAVPDWFRWLLPLETPIAMRDVSDGWKQVGRLTVVGDNSYAYTSLWRNALRQLALVLAAGLLWACVVIMLMRWLRRALDEQVARQVRAIAQDEELPPSTHAAMRELNTLVGEITQVRERVRANVYEMDAKIESLKLELNQDAVTGLANRKYFLNELRAELQDDKTADGHVMIMRIRDLAAVNTAHSRVEVDAWLRRVAQELQALATSEGAGALAARLNGSDFAVLMPGRDGPRTTRLAQDVSRKLRDLRLALPDGGHSRWAFSLTGYEGGDEAGMVMGVLDYGLMRAESAGHADVEYLPRDGGGARAGASEGAWRQLLRRALDENGLRLRVNEASYESAGPDAMRRSDAFLQLRDGDEWLPGSLFMPVAVRLNLSAECDLRAIELAVEWIRANRQDLVLRVSLASLAQTRFWPALRRQLDELGRQPNIARHLVFELDAHGLAARLEQVQQFCRAARAVSAGVGIRRLDAEPAALAKLHAVLIDHVRLTGPLIDSLSEGVGGAELLRAIVATARQLGLVVLSDAPGSEAARQLLRAHDVKVALP